MGPWLNCWSTLSVITVVIVSPHRPRMRIQSVNSGVSQETLGFTIVRQVSKCFAKASYPLQNQDNISQPKDEGPSLCPLTYKHLSLSQASCTKGMERTSSCPSSHQSSAASWATGAEGASPAPAAMGLLMATSSWPLWPSPVALTGVSMWETSTTSVGSSPQEMSPTSWR